MSWLVSESKWPHAIDLAAATHMELMEDNLFIVAIQKLIYLTPLKKSYFIKNYCTDNIHRPMQHLYLQVHSEYI